MTLNGVIALICVIAPNSIGLEPLEADSSQSLKIDLNVCGMAITDSPCSAVSAITEQL